MSRLKDARLGSGRYQEAPRNWVGLTCEAHEKKPGTLVGCAVPGGLSGEGTKVVFPKDG